MNFGRRPRKAPFVPRDNQRQRLYNAGTALNEGWGAKIGKGTLSECQAYVDALCNARWFQSRWGKRSIEVRQKTHGNATGYFNGHICMPPWARTPYVVLHEVAHVLCPPSYANHGPEYAALLLFLVKQHLGEEAGRLLRESFSANKVSYRTGVKSIPSASRPVVTKQQVQEKKRTEANRPVSPREAQQVADTLRRMARLGHLGESGGKLRTYALMIARKADELK
jgi:putative metallohydrolase (TIGR04338 family)